MSEHERSQLSEPSHSFAHVDPYQKTKFANYATKRANF
jgi:hypothetical protein